MCEVIFCARCRNLSYDNIGLCSYHIQEDLEKWEQHRLNKWEEERRRLAIEFNTPSTSMPDEDDEIIGYDDIDEDTLTSLQK